MLCSSISCGCGIVTSSLIITGSGGPGDPFHIDTNAFSVVTSGTRPAGPAVGQSILETDTKRYLYWDGTYWVIMGGQMPGCTAYITGGAQSLTSGTPATISLVSESYDIGGFHTGTNGFLTVPAGMAGDYRMSSRIRYVSQAVPVGQRTVTVTIGSNGSQTNPSNSATTFPTENTNNTGVEQTLTLRLIAGATVTLQGNQSSGGSLVAPDALLSLDMVRSIPSLT